MGLVPLDDAVRDYCLPFAGSEYGRNHQGVREKLVWTQRSKGPSHGERIGRHASKMGRKSTAARALQECNTMGELHILGFPARSRPMRGGQRQSLSRRRAMTLERMGSRWCAICDERCIWAGGQGSAFVWWLSPV